MSTIKRRQRFTFAVKQATLLAILRRVIIFIWRILEISATFMTANNFCCHYKNPSYSFRRRFEPSTVYNALYERITPIIYVYNWSRITTKCNTLLGNITTGINWGIFRHSTKFFPVNNFTSHNKYRRVNSWSLYFTRCRIFTREEYLSRRQDSKKLNEKFLLLIMRNFVNYKY